MLDINSYIYIAGHTGMVGSALVRNLRKNGFSNLILRTRSQLNLLDQTAVDVFFQQEKIDVVIIAAAKVGGIQANINQPVEFLLDNLKIQNNLLQACLKKKVTKVIFLASSCIYPKECPQPMREEHILTGPLEPTNEGYALAKLAGIKLLLSMGNEYGLNGFSVLPCNLYGPNDSFDLKHSHVLSALVRRFIEAKESESSEIVLWGTGRARREFLHVDDLADGIFLLLNKYESKNIINIGSGFDVSIKELAEMISNQVGFRGEIKWDSEKPDGMLRKCLDVSRMNEMGFKPKVSLETGIAEMINLFHSKRGEYR